MANPYRLSRKGLKSPLTKQKPPVPVLVKPKKNSKKKTSTPLGDPNSH